ncbi:winged helix-turn-helix domain-containing protein [Vibrio furnissii]|uniref:winged helix-turn-helix domain-containing protein n=1 Tax=Vibrio furnissii TaxID=29494 RepID=UPI001EE9FC3D|nr:winged helix-turn-helix domain-containing protein [Vibrio furnissii]MCG6267108.1 winged helix-turn-helix domain-containing protein [Vibrio furnissii]
METPNDKVVINSRFLFDAVEKSLTDAYDEKIIIGDNESRILTLLTSHPNAVLSREDIYQQVWVERGNKVDDSSLTQSISLLRKVLGDKATNPEYIKTEARIGYRFIAPVDPVYSVIPLEELVEVTEQNVQPAANTRQTPAYPEQRYINSEFHREFRLNDDEMQRFPSTRCLSQLITPLMVTLITALLLLDFNGAQSMLSFLYRRILE